jgi:hypothetical protein
MNAGTGRPAVVSQAAIALTTGLTAGRRVIRSRHSSSLGVVKVTGAPYLVVNADEPRSGVHFVECAAVLPVFSTNSPCETGSTLG